MCVFYPLTVNRLVKSSHLERPKRAELLNNAAKLLAQKETDEVVIRYLLTTTGYSLSGCRAMLMEARVMSKFLKGALLSEHATKSAEKRVIEVTHAKRSLDSRLKTNTLFERVESDPANREKAKQDKKANDPIVSPVKDSVYDELADIPEVSD